MNTAAKVEESAAISQTEEMTQILNALTALRRGEAGARLPHNGSGAFGKVAEVFNDLVEQNATMAEEFGRLSQVVGKEGKLRKRAALPNARGFWAASVDSINSLIDDLVYPTSEVGRVIGAVAQGDLAKSMALEMDGRPLEGEFLRTAKTINKMVEQLGNFSAEVTRVAREVGTEGKLGGQAKVKGTDVWDLTYAECVSRSQMRQIAEFLRRYVPGFEKSYAAQSGINIGVRETRRIVGEYQLNARDVLNARKFGDAIARGAYPIEAHSSYRVMPIVMATGQAAGVCAALAARSGTPIRDVPAREVQSELLRQGASLRRDVIEGQNRAKTGT